MSDGFHPWDMLLRISQDHTEELREIRQTLGGFGEALRQGHEVHKTVTVALERNARIQQSFHARIQAVEKSAKEKKEAKSFLSEMTEFVKAMWPYIAIVSVVTAKLLTGSAEPVMQWIEHLGGKG